MFASLVSQQNLHMLIIASQKCLAVHLCVVASIRIVGCLGFFMVQQTTTTEREEGKKKVSDSMKWRLGQRLLLEELLQDGDDAAGLGVVTVLRPGVLQQHIPVSAGLQELIAAKQGVVAHLRLPHKALQAVHVLDGLWGATERETVEGRGKR